MIKNVLVHIDNIEWFPIVALVLFLLVFAGAIVRAMSLSKQENAALGRLPLEDGSVAEGANRHE